MRDILIQLAATLEAKRPVAYCRLVETRGSTPQKAGALMLVFEDGTQAGTLGGGCVEADVKRQALAALQSGEAEIATFQLDSDYGWDDGLICGGRMMALIQPLTASGNDKYFQRLTEMIAEGSPLTEAVVFDGEKSKLPSATSFLFDERDELVAVMPPLAELEREAASAIIGNIKPLSQRPRPYATGGVSYLPVFRRCRLLVVGGGHVGQAVANMAADLDFEVCVTDDREDIISETRFPKATQRIAGPVEKVLPEVEITPDTYCLIVTRGHNHDEEALYYLAERGAAYVGMIGSKRKIRLIFEDLLEQGISQEALERVHAPVGIDIGSQTVPEIAVSICAELVSFRNRDGIVPGRPEAVSIASP